MYIIKCEKADCKKKATESITIIDKDIRREVTLCLCSNHASKLNEAIKQTIGE